MQRTLNNTIPQPQRDRQQGAQYSPAYTMASRIRNEQGRDRAAEYLGAMEPFLAPGEREHIAKCWIFPCRSGNMPRHRRSMLPRSTPRPNVPRRARRLCLTWAAWAIQCS